MLKFFALCVVALIPAAVGCGSPRMDATNKETIDASLNKMSKGMSDDQKQALFMDCLTAALVTGPDGLFVPSDGKSFSKVVQQQLSAATKFQRAPQMMKSLDGLTAAEIHAKAEEIRRGSQK